MSELAPAADRMPAAQTIEDVIARGDLAKLTPEQRVQHYFNVCNSLGLNPLTQPLQYITLQGKLVLYARRDAADQLRKINGINIAVVGWTNHEGLLTVHVKATDRTGRQDEDYGAVTVAGLRGEAAANAFLKAVTKAKRRVTLSISGLGLSDESEGEPGEERRGFAPAMPQSLDQRALPEHAAEPPPPAPLQPFAIEFDLDNTSSSAEVWSEWAKTLIAFVRAAPDVETINAWTNANAERLSKLQAYDAEKHKRLTDMINRQIEIRGEGNESR